MDARLKMDAWLNTEAQCLRFYVQEGMRHAHQPIAEWLFDQAQAAGISGGTVFRAAAGFGRHGLHEDHFFELAGTLPEAVEFIATPEAVESMLASIRADGLRLFYVSYKVTCGVTCRVTGV